MCLLCFADVGMIPALQHFTLSMLFLSRTTEVSRASGAVGRSGTRLRAACFESMLHVTGPTQQVAGGDDTLLHTRHLLRRHVQAQVATAEHDAVRRRQDAVKLVQRRGVLHLSSGNQGNRFGRKPNHLGENGSSLGPWSLSFVGLRDATPCERRRMRVQDWGSHLCKDLDMVQAQLVQHSTSLLQQVNGIVDDT